jgi:hypothetical protein
MYKESSRGTFAHSEDGSRGSINPGGTSIQTADRLQVFGNLNRPYSSRGLESQASAARVRRTELSQIEEQFCYARRFCDSAGN